jgi:hypothetical protein
MLNWYNQLIELRKTNAAIRDCDNMPHGFPLPGARTSQMKVPAETAKFSVRADGAELLPNENGSGGSNLDSLKVKFPAGTGYQQQTVILYW